ncbi:MAG TPA: aminoacyl-tRNA deacylase [Terriglobales bacterium]|nr:aminoacyl-tRNA deacylase [Terriglobales bacterium]
MSAEKFPVTPAVRWLRQRGAVFADHLYPYEERGGTAASARTLAVDEHTVVKTLVMEDDARAPLIVLMHGDREVSTRQLARQLGRRHIEPCRPEVAQRHTGYRVGGTSPFGTRQPLPVFAEASLRALPRLYINGGKRGYLVSLTGEELWRLLAPTAVAAAVASEAE